MIYEFQTLLRTPNPDSDWHLKHILPGLPEDYIVFECSRGASPCATRAAGASTKVRVR